MGNKKNIQLELFFLEFILIIEILILILERFNDDTGH